MAGRASDLAAASSDNCAGSQSMVPSPSGRCWGAHAGRGLPGLRAWAFWVLVFPRALRESRKRASLPDNPKRTMAKTVGRPGLRDERDRHAVALDRQEHERPWCEPPDSRDMPCRTLHSFLRLAKGDCTLRHPRTFPARVSASRGTRIKSRLRGERVKPAAATSLAADARPRGALMVAVKAPSQSERSTLLVSPKAKGVHADKNILQP
ncbi:hypothetical protein FB567DRAFT_264372 [Paraphoma chrysanthemicola]|uniref:Uncharacterized protein n=1 Tax=Paraphoma chrysanthemicola TaxID=798071 RepID=A0A8K0RAZ5_9PLEO|nr:hypothetical protein FB567DRAFT_264372 [Paraphoma chrysanthemicola]